METQGKEGQFQVEERDLKQILHSQLPEGADPANALTLYFQPPGMCENEFLLCKPPRLWCGTLFWQPQNINTSFISDSKVHTQKVQ